MGQPGAARAQPLDICVLDKQAVLVKKKFRICTLCISVFLSTLLPKEFVHVKLCNLRFELGCFKFACLMSTCSRAITWYMYVEVADTHMGYHM